MNSGKRSKRAGAITLHDRIEEWRRLLGRCQRRSTRKRVHALRVITLRLQAELEVELDELPRASHQAQSILQFSSSGERLRKVLGPVREIDVWLGKLKALRTSLAASEGYVPRSTRQCIRQLERFELRLTAKRRLLENRLTAAIRKRNREFADAAEEISLLVNARAMESDADAAEVIRSRFAEVARDFPTFDEENLHEFRKRIKMVRYLAEVHHSDPACTQIALQMKKLQAAIGEWHDWQALAREVRRHGSKTDAAELLAVIAAESLESALTTGRTITHKLLKQAVLPEAVAWRKAPRRVDHLLSEAADRKLA